MSDDLADPVKVAAVARLRAVWLVERVHKVGRVPANPPTPYIVASVSSGSAENYLLSAQHGSRSYRIVTQAIGATDDELDFAVARADAAFLDHSLVVVDLDCTPCAVETSSTAIRDPDGGALLSKTLTYTFTTYPLE